MVLLLLLAAAAAQAPSAAAQAPSAAAQRLAPVRPCVDASGAPITAAYCDPHASIASRVADLIGRMNATEKTAYLSPGLSKGLPHLGLPPFTTGEALHGVASGCLAAANVSRGTGCPSAFPAAAALGASFSDDLWREVGAAISSEARALANYGLATNLVFFTPNINLVKDVRWGRAQEVPGEDPTLTSRYVRAFAGGMQAVDVNETCCAQCKSARKDCACCGFVKTISTAKHYSVYDLEGYWNGSIAGDTWATDGGTAAHPTTTPSKFCATADGQPQASDCRTERFNYDAKPSKRELSESYLPVWRAAAPLVGGVMCSYNAVAGIPSCLHKHMQEDVLRQQLQFDGFIISDCTALCNAAGLDNYLKPFQGHFYTQGNVSETCRMALDAGTDANCGQLFKTSLNAAVGNGSVTMSAVETSLSRILTTMFKLGQMDPALSRFQQIPLDMVDSEAHRKLVRKAAQQSIILLKNEPVIAGGDADVSTPLLPLKVPDGQKTLRVAMIGPHANSTQALLSNYHGTSQLVNNHSALQAAQRRADLTVSYSTGANICDVPYPLSPTAWKNASEKYWGFPNAVCPRQASDRSGFAAAVAAAKAADVAVLFLGSDQSVEGEGFDRSSGPRPDVPRNASDDNGGIGFAGVQSELAQAVLAANPRTILVMIRGGAIAHEWEAANIPAIIDASYPGSLGGDAILDVLMGDFAPTARLPVTVYFQNFTETRDIRDASFRSGPGVTHRFFSDPVIWKFGHGLHYTSFSYERLDICEACVSTGTFALADVAQGLEIVHALSVKNTGLVVSGCVVLAMLSSDDVEGMPRQTLADFKRLDAIAPQKALEVRLQTTHHDLAVADEHGRLVLHPGNYTVKIGDIVAPAEWHIELVGTPVVIEDLRLTDGSEQEDRDIVAARRALKTDDDVGGDIPDDWSGKVAASDALFFAGADTDLPWRSQPGLANGQLGVSMTSPDLFLSGVWSNNSRVAVATQLPTTGLRSPGLRQTGALLDLREATFSRRWTMARQSASSSPPPSIELEQRWYAHRAIPSLFVMEVEVRVPCGLASDKAAAAAAGLASSLQNISISVWNTTNTTINIHSAPGRSGLNLTKTTSADGSRTVLVGETAQPEGWVAPVQVAVVSTVVPETLEFSSVCGNHSQRFVVAVRSTKSTPTGGSVLAAAQADYDKAMDAEAGALHATHMDAWGELWRSGMEIGGRQEAAIALNSSQYWVLSSLRDDWPYSCCGTGLYQNGWNGVSFWDCEMWHEPSLLLLHPSISKSMRQFRANNLAAAIENAQHHSHQGAMWPWESTGSGFESGPGSAEGNRELHISSDISFAFLQYYRATHDDQWLKDVAYPVLNATARYWQSRAIVRGSGTQQRTAHILDVMGPDEWHDHTNDSAFTNAGAKIALRFAATASEAVGDRTAPVGAWRQLADQLVIIYNETTRVTAEYDHYDGSSNASNPPWVHQPVPGLIKQADTVLLQYPLGYNQSAALSARNLEYYGKRVDVQGGPAMTWSVHTVGYLRIGQPDIAAQMFNRSYQNNVRQPFKVWDEVKIGSGVDHFTTGPGGFLQAITHGYGGAALGDKALMLRPSLPENADFLKLRRFSYLGVWLSLEVDKTGRISLEALADEPATALAGRMSVSQLEVAASAGGGSEPGSFQALTPGRRCEFAAGSELTVRAKE